MNHSAFTAPVSAAAPTAVTSLTPTTSAVELVQLFPKLAEFKIRIDKATNTGSVIDVIRTMLKCPITGCKHGIVPYARL